MSSRFNHQDLLEKDKLEVSSFLIYNKQYRELSNDAKLMYQYLIKRFSVTEHTFDKCLEEGTMEDFTFIDENNELFCFCSNDELRFVLNISEPTVKKCKKELVSVRLLEEVKQTAHKTNRLYINKVDMNLVEKEEFHGSLKAFKTIEQQKRQLKNAKRKEKKAVEEKNVDAEEEKPIIKKKRYKLSEPKNLWFSEPKKFKFMNQKFFGQSTKEVFSTKEFKSTKELIVNKEELINICNSFYSEFSIGRWSKQQWNTLIEQYADELLEGSRLHEIDNLTGYIKTSLKKIAYKHDLKYGKVNIPNNGIFYNWLGS